MSRRQWLICLSVVGLIFIVSTSWMIVRNQHNELWGRWPLIQLTSGWLSIFLFIGRKFLRDPRTLKAFFLGSGSALLLGLGFPPLPLTFLLFVAFIPLLKAFDYCDKSSRITCFLLCYHTVLLWNIFSTYWVANSSAYAAGIFANGVNALVMTLPLLSYIYIKNRLGRSVALVTFSATWIAFEFLHMHWDLYWPWLTLGNGLSKIHWAIQWYEFTGVFGGSAIILVVNYLLYQIFSQGVSTQRLVWLGALVIIPLSFSLIRYWSWSDQGEEIEVIVVQPNFEPHYEKFRQSHEAVAQQVLTLASPLLTSETDYLVLPETSFSRIDLDQLSNPGYFTVFDQLRHEYPQLKIAMGIGGYRILRAPEEISLPTTRSFDTQNGKVYLEEYNGAVQLDVDGSVDEYYKALFVPGAEFFPFRRFLFFLKPIVDQLGGTLQGYRTRTKFALFDSDQALIAPPICYESIFGEYINEFVKRGANLVFIMTNDGWWDNTAGHRQHAQFAKLRAIETRRNIARAANMGTTCFVNTRGDILQPSRYGEAAAKSARITIQNEVTFYVRWGDVIGRICVFIAGLLLLRSFILQKTRSTA